MHLVQRKLLMGLAGALAMTAMVFATAAHAAPIEPTEYPKYGFEGRYPEQTPCRYRLKQTRMAFSSFRLVTLKYFYSRRCGSFARIDNAPPRCQVNLVRHEPGTNPNSDVIIAETVDQGIDFAYTKVVDNLQGRTSQAILQCKDRVLVSTTPY